MIVNWRAERSVEAKDGDKKKHLGATGVTLSLLSAGEVLIAIMNTAKKIESPIFNLVTTTSLSGSSLFVAQLDRRFRKRRLQMIIAHALLAQLMAEDGKNV